MDAQELDKIKDRIAKLLRMAKDASSPNEAAIAAQRARSLMDKHQLDAFDVDNRFDDEFADTAATRFYASLPQYLSLFACAIAKYNDCQGKFESGKVDYKKKAGDQMQAGKRIVFLGLKSDVELAIQMFNELTETVNRLCKEFMTAHHSGKYNVKIGSQFKLGAFLEIAQRLSAMTVERDALTSSNGNSLVVMKSAVVEAKFGKANYKMTAVANPDDDAADLARRVGREKASRIELVKSVEA